MLSNSNLISIIIPVYNVEKYIDECLSSVLNQNYNNIEIILVNDGSTDRSREICERYLDIDDRVILINKNNGGLSDARNIGINASHGNWVTFVDSDDTIAQNYCDVLLSIALGNKSDVVIGECMKTPEEQKFECLTAIDVDFRKIKKYDSYESLVKYYYRSLPGYACGMLINQRMIDDLRFPVGHCFEDAYFVPRLLQRANNVSYCQMPLYFYRQRRGSIVNSNFSYRTLDQYYMTAAIPKELVNITQEMREAVNSKIFISGLDMLRKAPFKNTQFQHEISKIKHSLLEPASITKLDKHNSFLVRTLARIYMVSPLLAISISKMRRYVKVSRV